MLGIWHTVHLELVTACASIGKEPGIRFLEGRRVQRVTIGKFGIGSYGKFDTLPIFRDLVSG